MKVLVIAGLSNAKLYSKIQPLLAIESISEIVLIRRKPLSVKGVKDYCPPAWMCKILPLAECYRLLSVLIICLLKHPDRIIAFYMVPHGVYAWLAGILFRIKTIQLLVGTDLDCVIGSRFLRYILRKAQYIGLRGEKALARLQQYGIEGRNVFYPPNVFDISEFLPDESSKKDYDFVYLGGLVPPKRLEMLIGSVAILRKKHPDVRVALIGDGILRRQLEDQAVTLQVNDNIFFLGAIDRPEVSKYLNMGRVFIMTSRTEGLPMAMIEALSCGLPVIMPDVGDVTSIAVHNVNGLIVDPATDKAFSKAMHSLMAEKKLFARLKSGAIKSRELFKREYSLESVGRIWVNILGLEGK